MGIDRLLTGLREAIHKEQELYKIYSGLAQDTEDPDLQELLGHYTFETFTHLNTLMDHYKQIIDNRDVLA